MKPTHFNRSHLATIMTYEQFTYLDELTRKAYTNVPDHAIGSLKDRFGKSKGHNLLIRVVCYALTLHGHQAEKINTMGRPGKDVITRDVLGRICQIEKKWLPSSGKRGSADISATVHGRSVKIEAKWGKDIQRPDQKEYQAQIERAGGEYIIARHLDDIWHLLQ